MWEAPDKDLFADDARLEARGRSVTGELTAADIDVERSLRPRTLGEYCGQERVRDNLRVLIVAAKGWQWHLPINVDPTVLKIAWPSNSDWVYYEQ